MTQPAFDEFDAELDGFPLANEEPEAGGGDVLERLASRYVAKVRQGELPETAGFAADHPELAAELEELLPIAQALEQWKTQKEADCLRQNRPAEYRVRQLGDCEIVREIGRGGMGVVFEARQGLWKRPVAVKMLPWKFGDALPQWKQRFEREAKTIAGLRHQNIVPVYTFGEHDGYCYYVMQLVEGSSLDRVLADVREADSRAQPLSALARRMGANDWPTIAKIGQQVAQALEHAHGLGVLHNDIKPANLLVDRTGQILVTDFCAHQLNADWQESNERATGTYRYLAPERLFETSDVRSDVYSFGATLYELLTRWPAFEGTNRTELLERIARSEFVLPRKVRPEIPWELEAIVLKAMSPNPEARYQSAREMGADLMRFLHGRPISVPRPGFLRRLLERCGGQFSRRSSWQRTRRP